MAEETDEEIRRRLSLILGTDYLPEDIAERLREKKKIPSMTVEEVQKAEPGLGGSYPLLTLVGGAKGARSLMSKLYLDAMKASEPAPTLMKVEKGKDYLPIIKGRPTKQGTKRSWNQRAQAPFLMEEFKPKVQKEIEEKDILRRKMEEALRKKLRSEIIKDEDM